MVGRRTLPSTSKTISVRGLGMEIIERMSRWKLAVFPPESDRREEVRATEAMWRKWSRWGVFDFTSHLKPQPIVYAAAFDPDTVADLAGKPLGHGQLGPPPRGRDQPADRQGLGPLAANLDRDLVGRSTHAA